MKEVATMYSEYKRNWSTDEACWNPAVHENYPEYKKAMQERTRTSDVTYVNKLGDRFTKDLRGRITSFRYRHNDTTYCMSYDEQGQITSVSSSDGWTWTRVQTEDYSGWLVRNYFERWQVSSRECGTVIADENGI
ncbi:MAG TPA: hypothetical protein V6D17_12065, partial [Candidatus Obscuribacterales bacterium]